MATQLVQGGPLVLVGTERTAGTAEAIAAAAAIILAIVGLAGAAPTILMSIATLLLGGALLAEGSVGPQSEVLSDSSASPLLGYDEDRLGRSAERIGGAVGVVLGVLALAGVIRVTFGAVALIGFGGALLLGSLARRRLGGIGTQVSSVSEFLAGYAALLLGYLALIGFASVPLVLIGILAVGACLLLSGSMLGTYVLGPFDHATLK